ncbi:MAG: hypothetical protein JWQ88_1700 [Rhodoferax sp.]|nr:hypothetical protein [Rhodoferax sp.]
METTTELVLLQWPWDAASRTPSSLMADFTSLMERPDAVPLLRGLRRLACSASASVAYAYLVPSVAVDSALLSAVVDLFGAHCPGAGPARASRLEQVFDTPGASAGAEARFHYAVEMDPDPGWMPEIARWYDTEHMPGLAAVPGCIRASRFLNHGHGPLSLACYDLVTEDTLGSPPWLAVRGTAWSDITRPHFTNTRRTMFEVPQPRD